MAYAQAGHSSTHAVNIILICCTGVWLDPIDYSDDQISDCENDLIWGGLFHRAVNAYGATPVSAPMVHTRAGSQRQSLVSSAKQPLFRLLESRADSKLDPSQH